MTVLDRVPDRVALGDLSRRVAQVLLAGIAAALYGVGYGAYKTVRVLLTILAGVLYGVGWAAYHVCRVSLRAARWSAAAVKLGWTEARAGGPA